MFIIYGFLAYSLTVLLLLNRIRSKEVKQRGMNNFVSNLSISLQPSNPLYEHPAIILITGIMASGKSSVAQQLAERFPMSVHVRGDVFRRMVVSGREEMTPDASGEALRQLHVRYSLAAHAAKIYHGAGFHVVVQDNYLGVSLQTMVNLIERRPLFVVVLCPRPDIVEKREAARNKTGYRDWSVAQLDFMLRAETPHIGVWVDSSDMNVSETVDEILRRLPSEGCIGL